MRWLKKAELTNASTRDAAIEADTRTLLDELRQGGAQAAQNLARRFDGWEGEIVVSADAIDNAYESVSASLKTDIDLAYQRVTRFADAQRGALTDLKIVEDGVTMGHKVIPVDVAGCYVPGGRYAHIASAIMSIATAKAAGVKTVVATTPAKADAPIHPTLLYTMHRCGADQILALGGVQGIAALAFGFFNNPPADILVGPGNAYVAEAKRQLFGEVGIDMFAGPTEMAIIIDESADPDLVAIDLVGQAEHGVTTPSWLISTDLSTAEKALALIPGYIEALPQPARDVAASSWRDYGEVVVCDDREEAARLSDRYGSEHLQVHAKDLDWWHNRLRVYGSLFLGPEASVTYGDKVSGPNHVLPTKGAARYTGGLNVYKFLKTLSYESMSPQASAELGEVAARICREEGMEAHARTADARVKRYRSG